MVRVQAGRLRSKLAEYYASEGAEDTIVVEMPKGNYALTFHQRVVHPSRGNGSGQAELASASAVGAQPYRWRFAAILGLSVVSAAVLAVAADRIFFLASAARPAVEAAEAPAAFRIFWKGFLTGPQEPWVIFSNALFAGRPDTGMRYYKADRDGKVPTLDHYTGVGEVLAVHALDRVFDLLHQDLLVKRGSLFSLDDAKNNDLIFIGSPSENLTLLEIPGTQEFVFTQLTTGVRAGNVAIINMHPQANEPKEYLATPSNEPLTEDYSVVALVKGLNPAHSALILAGTTTIGTQAAVEYVCQPDSLEKLLMRLSVSNSGELKPFEAVIRVKVARGVPVSSELVALRKGPF